MVKYTADLSVKDVDKTIKAAMDLWAKVTPLTFTKVTSGPADIDIFFDKAGDKGYSFDGRGGELAFAYFPGNNAGTFLENIFRLHVRGRVKTWEPLFMGHLNPFRIHTSWSWKMFI